MRSCVKCHSSVCAIEKLVIKDVTPAISGLIIVKSFCVFDCINIDLSHHREIPLRNIVSHFYLVSITNYKNYTEVGDSHRQS